MEIKIYQVDAFTQNLFQGNPAAVCLLDEWLDEELLQKIALENNLSETAFIVPREGQYHIRWFTPSVEVDLCGHATLAAAFCVFNLIEDNRQAVSFYSKSGPLQVSVDENKLLTMDFPALSYEPCDAPQALIDAIGVTPLETYASKDYLVILESEKQLRDIKPDLNKFLELDLRGVILSARGDHVDFVSRFFTPKKGVLEDPVTGSAHCVLTPYWSEVLGKSKLHARQISKRTGEIFCEQQGDRVLLKGYAKHYMSGTIKLID